MSLLYELTYGSHSFYAILNKSNEANWELFIGGKKHGCIFDSVLDAKAVCF